MSRIEELIKELCPNGVEYKKLKDISEMKRGTSITKKDICQGKIPVISGGREPAYWCDTYNRDGETITVAGSGAGAGYLQYWTIPIHNVRVRSIRPCSFPLKWRYGLTKFPIGTSRPQTNVSASLHCFVLDSASWDIAPVSRLNMCVLWKSWIAINRNERRNVNARSRNRYFQVKKCSSHLKPRRINAHKSF